MRLPDLGHIRFFLLVTTLHAMPCLGAGKTAADSPLVLKDDADTITHWYVINFDGKPVGYEKRKSFVMQDSVPTMLSCFRKTQIQLKRLGQDLTVTASLWTKQQPDGLLHYFNLQRVDGDGARIHRTGTYQPLKSTFQINEKTNATRRTFTLRAPGGAYSPIFSEWLPAQVLSSRSRVVSAVLFPESGAIANINADRRRDVSVRLGDGKKTTGHQIVFAPQLAPEKRTTLVTDKEHTLLKSELAILGGTLTLMRTTAEVALNAVAKQSLDLDFQAPIPVSGVLTPSARRQRLVIDLSVTDGFLPPIPQTAFQTVIPLNSTSARITLMPVAVPKRESSQVSLHQRAAIAPTHWMPLNDARLQRMAATAASGEADTSKICQRLEAFVNSRMRRSAFTTSILPADIVAKHLRGDCTEHAILLASLIRIKRIPSRIVSGLRYSNQQFGFIGHAWVEAYINKTWIPFDSTVRRQQQQAAATYIKLADSELPDDMGTGISLFLPILDLAGRAGVSVVSDNQEK